jgi:hypothetical protein
MWGVLKAISRAPFGKREGLFENGSGRKEEEKKVGGRGVENKIMGWVCGRCLVCFHSCLATQLTLTGSKQKPAIAPTAKAISYDDDRKNLIEQERLSPEIE